MALFGLFNSKKDFGIVDKYKSISIERVNNFLDRTCIEHQCTELRKIVFKLEDWSWDLYIDDDYFKMVLVFPITEENAKDKHINNHVAEKACLEVTKLIKVLKAHYTSHEYVDEDNEDKLVKYNILLFNFETYCYNMYDFSKLFYDGINVILGGYQEYHKLYDEIRATLPSAPIGFRAFESNVTNDNSQTINGHRIGFV